MNFNNNYSCRDKLGYDEDSGMKAAGTSFLPEKQQNDLNAKEDNCDRSYGIRCGNSQYVRSKRMAVAVCAVVGLILILGIAAMFAFIVVIGMLNAQHARLNSLQDEIAALKVQNEALKNETVLQESRASACENELQRVKHLLDLSEMKCNVEKTNISNHFQAEIRNIRAEKETLEQNLSECQGQTRNLMDQKSALESEKARQEERLDRCNREKNDLSNRVAEQARQLDNIRCPPCSTSNANYYSRNNAEGSSSISTSKIFIFFALLLSSFYFYN